MPPEFPWEKGNKFEAVLLKNMESSPKQVQLEVKRLLKRKKNKFSADPRVVGQHWIKEHNGEFIFGCDARLNIENMLVDSTIH